MSENDAVNFMLSFASNKFYLDIKPRISLREGAEIVHDQMMLIKSDCKLNNSKAFSQRQVDRLSNTERILQFKEYSNLNVRDCKTGRQLYDNCQYERYVYYKNISHKKGFQAQQIAKCTKIKHDGLQVYMMAFPVADTEDDICILVITSHLLDRLVSRKNLDVIRIESIFEILREYSKGLFIYDKDGEVIIYSNDGIALGHGCGYDSTTMDLLPSMHKRASTKIFYLSTYVTNEMAHSEQIENAAHAAAIKLRYEKIRQYLDKETYQLYMKK